MPGLDGDGNDAAMHSRSFIEMTTNEHSILLKPKLFEMAIILKWFFFT